MHEYSVYLPSLDFINLFFRFSPGLDILFRPIDMAFGISDLVGLLASHDGGDTPGHKYHVAFKVFLLLKLKPLQVFQDSCASILNIPFRHGQSLLKLEANQTLAMQW